MVIFFVSTLHYNIKRVLYINEFRYLKDTDDFNHGQENMRLKKAWSTKTKKQEFFYNVATKSFSFLIARHPFSRLLSAYK